MDRKEKVTKDELVNMRIIPLRLLLQKVGADVETEKKIRVYRRKIRSREYARTYRRKTKQLLKEKEELTQEKEKLQREISILCSMIEQG